MSEKKEKEKESRATFLQNELEKIRRPNGLLFPQDIVRAAAKKTHPLHTEFEWRNTEAARRYRLLQAQRLIRYVRIVEVTPDNKLVAVRLYESLPSDRRLGQGYRTIHEIMNDRDKTNELLASALRELQSFRMRYQQLCELAGVIREVEVVEVALEKEMQRAARKRARRTPAKRPPARSRTRRTPKGPGAPPREDSLRK
jgi:hypothetical protein